MTVPLSTGEPSPQSIVAEYVSPTPGSLNVASVKLVVVFVVVVPPATARTCAVCDGSWEAPVATLRLEDLDLDEHFAGVDEAFDERGGGRADLHGLDS